MGYHNILPKSHDSKSHRAIAMDQIFQSMNRRGAFSGKKIPDIQVALISNLSKVYHGQQGKWWTRLIYKLGLF
jgi:hypothetical protein